MYYNMRVRMAQRKLADMRLSLTTQQATMQEVPEESLRTISHSIKNVCEIGGIFLRRYPAAGHSTQPVPCATC